MKEDTSKNQIPILKFLNKHKWRIILPLSFSLFYLALPRYTKKIIAVQQNAFFKSSVLGEAEMIEEFSEIKEQVLSDESLKNLILKYDLYKTEREANVAENVLVEKLRNSVEIRIGNETFDRTAFIWIRFNKENSQNIAALSGEVMNQFEKNPDIHIDKYVSNPYDANVYRSYVFFGALLQGFVMLVIPLILLWEIPNMFYSPKTKEMVFEPLKSDWQNELTDAKMRKQPLKAFQINIQYSYSFIAAIIQKSPLGDLVEFVRKFAK